jgi:hypothetical protein
MAVPSFSRARSASRILLITRIGTFSVSGLSFVFLARARLGDRCRIFFNKYWVSDSGQKREYIDT